MGVYHTEGRYRVRIQEAVLGQAKKGTPQVELTLDLQGVYDQNGELYETHQGQYPPICYLSITDATMGNESQPGWVASTLAYLGFQGDFDAIAELANAECDALCKYEDDQQGNQREHWSILRPGAGRQIRPPEKKTVRSLNTKFTSMLKKLASPATNPAKQAQPQPALAARAEEPIPF